jgi:hypothetical protein
MAAGSEAGSGWTELVLTGLGWTDPILLIGVLALGVVVKRPWMMILAAIAWSFIVAFIRNPALIFFPAGSAWFLGHAIGAMTATTLVFVIADTVRKYRAGRRENGRDT